MSLMDNEIRAIKYNYFCYGLIAGALFFLCFTYVMTGSLY